MDLLCLNDYVDQLSLSQCQNHKTLHTMLCFVIFRTKALEFKICIVQLLIIISIIA